jgi:uncharacterized membrane protein YqjE
MNKGMYIVAVIGVTAEVLHVLWAIKPKNRYVVIAGNIFSIVIAVAVTGWIIMYIRGKWVI